MKTCTMSRETEGILVITLTFFTILHAQECIRVKSLGLSDPNVISNDRIITSSVQKGHENDQIRLDCCEGTLGSAWCPNPADKAPFVEIHLEKPVPVAQIAIQPPTVTQESQYPEKFLKTFDLLFKLPGFDELITAGEDIKAITNKSVSLVRLSLDPPVFTDVIRVVPKTYENLPCFRMELYECDTTTLCPEDYCANNGSCSALNTCDCPPSFFGEKCQWTKSTIPVTVYRFLKIVDSKLITASYNLTFVGDVTLSSDNSVAIKPGAYIELFSPSISSCLSNLDGCFSGFTITLEFRFSNLDGNMQAILTNGAAFHQTVKGVTLFYSSGDLECYVSTSTRRWSVSSSVTLEELKWYKITVSWSPNFGLILLLDNSKIGSSFISFGLDVPASVTRQYMIGYDLVTSSAELYLKTIITVPLFWHELIWADLETDKSTTPSPNTSPAIEDKIEEHFWNFKNISETVSHGWQVTLIGSPIVGKEGVILNGTNQQIEIPDLGGTCLTDPTLCKQGLTVQIKIKLTTLEEDTAIFTTGGEKPDQPGVALLYRYGYIHAIVSTSELSWYVSVSRKTFWTSDFSNIIVSWSKDTSLKLILNEVLISESESPVPHSVSTVSTSKSFTIGGGNTNWIVSELHIWVIHIEILLELKLVVCGFCTHPTTTPQPTTRPAPAVQTSTVKELHSTTYSTFPSHSSETTIFDYEEECPIGCVPSYECFEEPTAPPPVIITTFEPCPVTNIPTTPEPKPPTQPPTAAESTTPPKQTSQPITEISTTASQPSSTQESEESTPPEVCEEEITTPQPPPEVCEEETTISTTATPPTTPSSAPTTPAPPPTTPSSAPTTPAPAPTTPAPGPTTPAPGPTTPVPAPTTPAPGPTTPAPGPTTPAPGPTTPAPGPTTPAPPPTTPAPGPTTPAPAPTTPAPGSTTPAPGPTTPAPGPTNPAPGPTTPAPGPTTPAPGPTTPSPAPTTPAPGPTTPAPAPTTPAPGPTTPAPAPTTPAPAPTTPAPGPTTPAPAPTTPAPGPTTPAPGPTTPAPGPTTPAPAPTTPAPGPTTPAPGPTTPAPGPTTPAPAPTTPAPAPTTPAPAPTTPAPGPTTPAPAPTTPAPGPTTPAPGPTTPAPGPTTPAPGPTTPAPGPTTPAPGPTTPAPAPTTPAPAPTTPAPPPTTPSPDATTPAPAPTTPAPAPTTPSPDATTPAPAPTTPAPGPTTPSPAPTTPSPAPTTSIIPTSTTTTTTTEISCPEPPSDVSLTPDVNANGQGQLTCSVPRAPQLGIAIKFTWRIEGESKTWSKEIEAPDRSATISVTELGVTILNKKVTCTAEVRYLVQGAEWCWPESSNVVVPSIKCPPVSGTITVTEGREEQYLWVNFTVPPSLLCKAEDNGQCRVEVTTTVTTVGNNELRCSFTEIIPQAVLGVSTVRQGGSQSCGIAVTAENWQGGVAIPIKATVDGIKDGDRRLKLTISVRIVGQVSLVTSEEICGEIDITVIDRDEGSTCSSVNDPHMKTFDNVRYNNHMTGEFLLYMHTTKEYEVRAQYKPCSALKPSGATCNCGAAVRSGDDVITFDTCNTRQNQVSLPIFASKNSVITVDMYKNGALTPGTRVIRHGCGQKYEVHLPIGTKVIITSSTKPFLNINIQASSYDFERTEGLCGFFNNKGQDDLGGHTIRNPDEFNKQWKRDKTIFKGVAPINIPTQPTYCSCLNGRQPICKQGLDVYICSVGNIFTGDITDALVSQAKTPVVQSQRRRRRAADVISLQDPVRLDGVEYTEENATQYCKQALENSTAVSTCLEHLREDAVNESIRNCAEDLVALADPEWAESQIKDLIEECLNFAQRNASTWENNENPDGPNLPKALVSDLCILSCSEHGTCEQGVCQCKDGWTGETCQSGPTTIPTVLPPSEECDLLTSSCTNILVEGYNFVFSSNLQCKIVYIRIGETVSMTEDVVVVPAIFISMIQVVCPQPVTGPSKGRSALVTVSNDGVTYSSNSYTHIVYKSSCQSCILSEDVKNVSCTWKPDTCVMDGQCYSRYEDYDGDKCYRCDPDVSQSRWTQKSDPGCEATAEAVKGEAPSSNNDTTVIVLGVLCGVLALATVGVAIGIYKAKRSKNSKTQRLEQGDGGFDVYRRNVTPPGSIALAGTSDAARLNAFYNPLASTSSPQEE